MKSSLLGKPWVSFVCLLAAVVYVDGLALAARPGTEPAVLQIKAADYGARKNDTKVQGDGAAGNVVLTNADTGDSLGNVTPDRRGKWRLTIDHDAAGAPKVPCRVKAADDSAITAVADVTNAPVDCDRGTPPPNTPPNANANGPYSGTTTSAVGFSSAGSSDPDGSVASFAWNFGDGGSSGAANPTHTYAAGGTFDVSLTVTDNDGASTNDTTTATITAEPPPPHACEPIPTDPQVAHSQCITDYTGPQVCVACHQDQARDMHSSVHYQQGGAFPNITNLTSEFASAGKRPARAANDLVATGINTYCGTTDKSPRFTCAGCHVGNGRFPMAQSEFEKLDPNSAAAHEQLANIDCLTCHQEVYKRFPDPAGGFDDLVLENVQELGDGTLFESPGNQVVRTGLAGIPSVSAEGDFQFIPADPTNSLLEGATAALMSITALEAAQSVHPTTRQSCLSCHGGAGGGDGTKRGDMSSALIDPSLSNDMHMSGAGAGLTCSDCHSAVGPNGEGHRVRGRGLDLRPNDVPDRFTCEDSGCHGDQPHADLSNTIGASRDKHATKVACQSCHIPIYAKGVATEVFRDWQHPHVTQTACNGRGGWLPNEVKGTNLEPTYAWFDGTSDVYYLGEPLTDVPTVPLDDVVAGSFGEGFDTGNPAFVLGMPNGAVTDPIANGAKLYPMKEHWSKLGRHIASNTLIGHSTFEFFRTGSFDAAVESGLAQTGRAGEAYDVVPVHTYQTINHGVESSGSALECGDCHNDPAFAGGPPRMDLQTDLGYELKASESVVCGQCHGFKTSKGFVDNHRKHVEDKGKDCSVCHTFSRPERGLSTAID